MILLAYLKDVKSSMTSNSFFVNLEKTEAILFGPKLLRDRDVMSSLDGISLASTLTMTNLGVTFDQDLSFNANIKRIPRSAFFICETLQRLKNKNPR